MQNQEYDLSLTGAQIESILTNAAADHDKIGAADGIAPLGADGKVPAENLPAQDSTLRFDEVVRLADAEIISSQPTKTFSVVWLDNSPSSTYTWAAPSAQPSPLSGRFVARADNSATTEQPSLTESADASTPVSTVSYHADWEGREDFCTAAGAPLSERTYLCRATGRQYDCPAAADGLRCIAAPPMDAKKALLADLWNEACCNEGWGGTASTRTVHGYYDADADAWLLNGLTLTYDEAIAVWYASTPRKYSAKCFYGGWHTIRTNLPWRVDSTNLMDATQAFIGSTGLEVANIGRSQQGTNMFYQNQKLTKVIGTLYARGDTINPSLYASCPVEEFHLSWWGTSLGGFDLHKFPDINAESLQWMITNAQATTSGTRTVTLHADAYARLTEEMLALAAEKSITFVLSSE